MNGANQALLGSRDTQKMLEKAVSNLYKKICSEEHNFIVHCAAGVHRTGTIGYSLLRVDGVEPAAAYLALKDIRKETYAGVGEWRIELAEKLIVPRVLKVLAGVAQFEEERAPVVAVVETLEEEEPGDIAGEDY